MAPRSTQLELTRKTQKGEISPRCRARVRHGDLQCLNSAVVETQGFALCWIHYAVELITGAVPIYRGRPLQSTTVLVNMQRVVRRTENDEQDAKSAEDTDERRIRRVV